MGCSNTTWRGKNRRHKPCQSRICGKVPILEEKVKATNNSSKLIWYTKTCHLKGVFEHRHITTTWMYSGNFDRILRRFWKSMSTLTNLSFNIPLFRKFLQKYHVMPHLPWPKGNLIRTKIKTGIFIKTLWIDLSSFFCIWHLFKAVVLNVFGNYEKDWISLV